MAINHAAIVYRCRDDNTGQSPVRCDKQWAAGLPCGYTQVVAGLHPRGAVAADYSRVKAYSHNGNYQIADTRKALCNPEPVRTGSGCIHGICNIREEVHVQKTFVRDRPREPLVTGYLQPVEPP